MIFAGDLIEIVYNSQFKLKGYFVKTEKFGNNYFRVFYKDFLTDELKQAVVSKNTEIRNKKRIKNYIYCITCNQTGKQYIGRTSNDINTRFNAHFAESKQSYSQTPLHIDMRKYGKSSFSVEKLYEYYADRQKDANIIEQKFIKELNTEYPNGYNISVFGV